MILKLIAIGPAIGVVIPEEMLARLNLAEGDLLHAVETPDGGYHLTPVDPDDAGIDDADETMQRYQKMLSKLTR